MVQSVLSSRAFIRDAVVSTLVLVGLYGLAQTVQFQPVGIPGYLLIVGFDAIEGVTGAFEASYELAFTIYLLGLGVVGAVISTALRTLSDEAAQSGWRVGMAGGVAVVGLLSLLYGVLIAAGTSQLIPVAITGGVGLVMLVVASWLAGVGKAETHS
jgi:hypothetical protein